MNKTNVKKITIPADIAAEFESMRVSSTGGRQLCPWTPEQDAILLKYYPIKRKKDVSKWWKKQYGYGSPNTLKRRYLELTK
jgi:hypothetical protein